MFWNRRSNVGPASGPHWFVPPPDTRSGLALGGGLLPGALVAQQTLRPESCAVPGCGKDRADPVHWPAEPGR
jgi:hypothetical protein